MLLTFLLLPLTYQCAAETEDITPTTTPATEKVDIDLATITNNYVDLTTYQGKIVRIGGHYLGDRIVLQNTSNLEIVFVNCYIHSRHAEDALVFADETVSNMMVEADGLHLEGGGITFWGQVLNVSLHGGKIRDGHTGIRATKDAAHNNINISGWEISDMTHEGIYLGVSQDTPKDNQSFNIFENTIVNTGWDAIQVGNTTGFSIYHNNILNAGNTEEYGQDYGITINPGSLGYVYENDIQSTPKEIQILDSRVFFHAP